jgi:type II secretory pathway pseudopilin PulG
MGLPIAGHGLRIEPGWRHVWGASPDQAPGRSRPSAIGGAFTLVELMISMVLVLILALGVSAVFRWTGQTISAGQAYSTATRNYRSAMSVMTQDLRNVVQDSPAFVIYSGRVNRAMNYSDNINATGYVGAYGLSDPKQLQFDYRHPKIHRVDMVRFCARGLFRRQSANEGAFSSLTTSAEAWVTYGHVGYWSWTRKAKPPATWTGPNEYMVQWQVPEYDYGGGLYTASEWTLGRSVVLLRDSAAVQASGETYLMRDGSPPMIRPDPRYDSPPRSCWEPVDWPWWYRDPLGSNQWQTTFNLSPLCFGSPSNDRRFHLQDSRYDIAGTTIDGFRQLVADAKARQTAFPLPAPGQYAEEVRIVRWWHPLVFTGQQWLGGESAYPSLSGGGHPRFVINEVPSWAVGVYYVTGWVVAQSGSNYRCIQDHTSVTATNRPGSGSNWTAYWQRLPAGNLYSVTHPPRYHLGILNSTTNFDAGQAYSPVDPWRFGCDPDVVSPLTSVKAAQAASHFLQYCSQFAVEYAGDFLTQADDGTVTAAEPDGQIDFLVRTLGGSSVRETRWYGMPRDLDGDGRIYGWQAGRTAQNMLDVVPLRDIVRTAPGCNTPPATPENPGTNYYYGMPHEKDVEGLFTAPLADYGDLRSMSSTNRDRLLLGRYVCVWTDDVPAMIRIWMQVDDPTERVLEGQRIELVFRLK